MAETQTCRLMPFDKAGWPFVQTSLCRWWCGPVAGKTLEDEPLLVKSSQSSLELGLKSEELNDDCDITNYSTFSTFCPLVCFCCWQISNAGVCSQLSLIWFYATTLHLQSTVPKEFMNPVRPSSGWILKTGIWCIPSVLQQPTDHHLIATIAVGVVSAWTCEIHCFCLLLCLCRWHCCTSVNGRLTCRTFVFELAYDKLL